MVHRDCKDCCGPQWCLQFLKLGTRIDKSGYQSWWYTYTWLQEPAAGACVVARANYKHAYTDGVLVKQQGLRPPVVALEAAGALLLVHTSIVTCSCHGYMAVETSFGSQTGVMQVYSWRG